MYSGTMISSIASDWVIRKLGTGKVLVISVALTAITMLGFSLAGSFTMLCLIALLLPGIGSRILFLLIILTGIGCGPLFPSMVHHSPQISGPYGSQMLIGFQLAIASAGSIMIPALFGIIVNHISIALLPFFCLIFTLTLASMVLKINRKH